MGNLGDETINSIPYNSTIQFFLTDNTEIVLESLKISMFRIIFLSFSILNSFVASSLAILATNSLSYNIFFKSFFHDRTSRSIFIQKLCSLAVFFVCFVEHAPKWTLSKRISLSSFFWHDRIVYFYRESPSQRFDIISVIFPSAWVSVEQIWGKKYIRNAFFHIPQRKIVYLYACISKNKRDSTIVIVLWVRKWDL